MFKLKKIILSCILMLSLLVTSTSSVFAAESITPYSTNDSIWWSAGAYYYDNNFMVDNNRTYGIVNICSDGRLHISGSFRKADSASYSNVKLTVEIRDYPSGKVWAKGVFYNYDYPNETPFSLSANVQNGYRLQIFYDISSIDNPPGPYRKGNVSWIAEILPSSYPR